MFNMPCCKRSGIEPKLEKSAMTFAMFPRARSSDAIPISGVAHNTMSYWSRNGAKPSISSVSPSSPWPYTTPRPGCAVPPAAADAGMRQRKAAWNVPVRIGRPWPSSGMRPPGAPPFVR